MFLNIARPSSLYNPMFSLLYLDDRSNGSDRIKQPTIFFLEKNKHKFMMFDVKDFYPSITEKLL